MTRAVVFATWLLAAAAPAAQADTLYKCVDAAGLTAIQHEPCPKDQKQVWARETAPEPPPTPEELVVQQARREQAEREQRERAAAEAQAAREAAEAAQARAAERAQAEAKPPQVEPDVPDLPRRPSTQAKTPEEVKQCDDARAFVQSLRSKPWIGLDDAQWRRVYGWLLQQCR